MNATPPALVRGKYVLTGTSASGAAEVIADGAVLHADGVITEVGVFEDLASRNPTARVTGTPDSVVIPGLVNAHHHVGLTPLQLGSLDHPVETWMVTRMGARPVDPYLDTLYSAFEMIESGVTTVQHIQGRMLDPAGEGQERISAVMRAYSDVGMRVSFSVNLRDQNHLVYEANDAFLARLPSDLCAELAPLLRTQAVPLSEQLKWFFDEPRSTIDQYPGGRVRIQLAPANLHWCSDDALAEIADRATKAGVPMHMHLLETAYQREYARRRTEHGAIAHLGDLGVLGCGMTLGHGVWLTEQDLDVVAQTGTRVCHNPSSNLRLKSGLAPINELLERHVPIALGIDEAGVNDDRDMLTEMRLALHLHRAPGIDSPSPTAADVLRMATEHGAETTGFAGCVGRLQPGYRADLVLLDWREISRPYLDRDVAAVDAVVRRAKPSAVREVIVEGETIFTDGHFTKIDREATLEALEEMLASPIPDDVQKLRDISGRVLPHVKGLYADWLSATPGEPFSRLNSRT